MQKAKGFCSVVNSDGKQKKQVYTGQKKNQGLEQVTNIISQPPYSYVSLF